MPLFVAHLFVVDYHLVLDDDAPFGFLASRLSEKHLFPVLFSKSSRITKMYMG